jgi:signal transduction histidine kinase
VRRRLALLVAATTAIVVAAFLVPLILLVREIAVDRAISAGTNDAQNVAAAVGVLGSASELRDLVDAVNASGDRLTTVVLPDGRVLGPALGSSPSVALARSGRAFTATTDQGREILVPVETAAGRAVVRTLVPAAELRSGVPTALAVLVALGVALVLLAVAVADRLARWTLRPVTALSDTAHRLAHGDLSARVQPAGPPELVEVCVALNLLADRIGELLARERESVADLSHRLRTPLTALRLEAHGLAEPAESARMLALVGSLERTVDQLIEQARRPGQGGVASSDAVAVVRRRVEFWSALADDQDRQLTIRLPSGPRWVRLSSAELEGVVDALLENVFAHTPDGTDFSVWLEPAPSGGTSLVVADSGPGLPTQEAARRGFSLAGSTGLGLDIVRRAAEASGGGLVLGRGAAGGAQVRVDLGAAIPA